MAVRSYPFIAREGWPLLGLVLLAASVASVAIGVWALPLWGLALALAFLFRDPSRPIPATPLGVLSPADGYVVAIDNVRDAYLEREALRVTIDMRWSGVFSLRAPVEGKLVQHWRGAPSGDSDPDGRTQALWVRSDEDDDVVTVLRPSRWSLRSTCYYQVGERIGQGRRCGFILLGSRIDLLLPLHSRILVKPGDCVLSGTSIVAQLIHRDARTLIPN